MSKPLSLLLGTLLLFLVGGQTSPAEARLGTSIVNFERSELLRGDRLFRFEGRIGARFRFGPARRNTLGNPLLYVDTQDGRIVQELLILNFPRQTRDRRTAEQLLKLFWLDVGLSDEGIAQAERAWEKTLATGQSFQQPVGSEQAFVLDIHLSTALARILVAVGYRPTALISAE